MAKSYSITNIQESGIKECRPFNSPQQNDIINYSPTYVEILNIFKEVFKLVDLTQIIKRN